MKDLPKSVSITIDTVLRGIDWDLVHEVHYKMFLIPVSVDMIKETAKKLIIRCYELFCTRGNKERYRLYRDGFEAIITPETIYLQFIVSSCLQFINHKEVYEDTDIYPLLDSAKSEDSVMKGKFVVDADRPFLYKRTSSGTIYRDERVSSGWISIPVANIPYNRKYTVHDTLTEARDVASNRRAIMCKMKDETTRGSGILSSSINQI